jgi:hypothetical protein
MIINSIQRTSKATHENVSATALLEVKEKLSISIQFAF